MTLFLLSVWIIDTLFHLSNLTGLPDPIYQSYLLRLCVTPKVAEDHFCVYTVRCQRQDEM